MATPTDPSPPAATAICALSGVERPCAEVIAVGTLSPQLAARMRRDVPDLADDALISAAALARYRRLYVEEALHAGRGELSALETRVAQSIAEAGTLAQNVEAAYAERRTLGDKLADQVSTFGGSWRFLIYFGVAMLIWMAYNFISGDGKAFDPYPFILLNLILSTLAAIQAPIIMMSQKRQEAKDRMRSLNDFQINLKAELEIQHLHQKMDYMLTKQWQRMAEIQQIQIDIMEEKAAAPEQRPAATP